MVHPQDLQQDLQLAAEREDLTGSEHSGGGFSSADAHSQSGAVTGNEHLTKQVGLLWQMNEQHAKAYEQLHGTAGELEGTNEKLAADSKASQQDSGSDGNNQMPTSQHGSPPEPSGVQVSWPWRRSQGKRGQTSAPSFS